MGLEGLNTSPDRRWNPDTESFISCPTCHKNGRYLWLKPRTVRHLQLLPGDHVVLTHQSNGSVTLKKLRHA